MIKIGSTEISTIKIGNVTPSKIKIGNTIVWPSSYIYVLAISAVTYSNGGSALMADNSNSCSFICTYTKYRQVDSGYVETVIVTATPTATTYFKVQNTNQLIFDKDNYGTTAVSSGSHNITLSYGTAQPITASFNFDGNSIAGEYGECTEQVVPSSNLAYASGSTLSYSGGTGRIYNLWKSGIQEDTFNGKIIFDDALNSKVGDAIPSANVITGRSEIRIHSLTHNVTDGVSEYVFRGTNISGYTFTIQQERNKVESRQSTFKVYKGDAEVGDMGVAVGSDAGEFSIYVIETYTDMYTSGSFSPSPITNTLLNTEWTASTNIEEDSLIYHIFDSGANNKEIWYRSSADVGEGKSTTNVNLTRNNETIMNMKVIQKRA